MNKAFTLIELLVVVLIIGILSAIALPKYQLSIYKARFANMRSLAASYVRAAKVYKLETDQWPGSFDVLPVQEPGGSSLATPRGATCASNQQIYCCLNVEIEGYQADSITCGTTDYLFGYNYYFEYGTKGCYAKQNTLADNLCKSEGGIYARVLNLPSPVGHKAGYNYYTL